MKKWKIGSLLLVLALLVSLVPTAYAANTEIKAGQTIDYTVSLAAPVTMAGFKVYLDFDTTVFSMVNDQGEYVVNRGSRTQKGTLMSNVTATGGAVLWYHTNDVSGGGSLFTLPLKVAADAKPGVYPITLRYEAADTVNVKGELVPMTLTGDTLEIKGAPVVGKAAVAVGSAETFTGETVKLPVTITGNPGFSGMTLELQPVEGLTFVGAVKGSLLQSNETGTLTVNAATRRINWTDSENTPGDGELLVLEYRVEEDAAEGARSLVMGLLNQDPKNFVDCNSEPVAVTFQPGTVQVSQVVPGDADGDMEVTGADAVRMARHIVDYENLTEKELKAADLDKDGAITSADCVRLARYLVGYLPTLK